jgi:hypothetical protein
MPAVSLSSILIMSGGMRMFTLDLPDAVLLPFFLFRHGPGGRIPDKFVQIALGEPDTAAYLPVVQFTASNGTVDGSGTDV